MIKMIPLTRGLTAMVDDEDYALVAGHRWQAHAVSNGYFVASRTQYVGGKRTVYMHRVILGAAAGQMVDHINRNPLDNRRANLRLASPSQNQVNKAHLEGTYRGVNRARNRWQAGGRANAKRHHLGTFDTPEDAARAYDEFAKAHHGSFAQLNFPNGENA